MLYCSACQRITRDECPRCRKQARRLRAAQPGDPMLLFTSDFMRASMVEPLLKDSGIPYSKSGAMGAGLAMHTGSFMEKFEFYVPYGAHAAAVRLIAGTFGADAGFMRDLNTLGVDDADSTLPDPALVAAQYASPERHDVRRALHQRFTISDVPFTDWVLDHMALAPGMRILDIGCGSGDIWTHRPLPEGLHLTLADASEGMLDAARARTAGIQGVEFAFVRADACDLPFEDGAFDLALAANMLFHVEDVGTAIAELARVLRPEGRLCATTISEHNMRELYALAQKHGAAFPSPARQFLRENGAQRLEGHFSDVRRIDHASMLQVTEAEPLIDYIQSMDVSGMNSDAMIARMRSEMQTKIERDGSFDITKLHSIFVCIK
ncbi:MAG: class I SAM-dependent methyltransferase [Christensenellales bacterium]|jgi:ubiquinone/menaquinone biosynthesis C-methylase UbiE